MCVVRKPRKRGLYKNLPIFIVKFKLKLFHKSYVNYPNLHRYSKVEKAFSHLPGLELEVTATFKVEPVVHGTKSPQSCLTLCTPMGPIRLLAMGFSRQEYWRGLPCPHPRGLPDPGI